MHPSKRGNPLLHNKIYNIIPEQRGGTQAPTNFHSEIAEICPGNGVAKDTHTERNRNHLRFREMIVFKPTLVYPEYLVAYKRK